MSTDEMVRLICGTVFYTTTVVCICWIGVAALNLIARVGTKKQDE